MPRKKRKQKRLFGVYVSKEKLNLMDRKEITPLEAIFLGEIDSTLLHYFQQLYSTDRRSEDYHLCRKYGLWLTSKSVAQRYQVSVRRVEQWLQSLEQKGFITRKVVKQKNGYHKRFVKTVWTDRLVHKFLAKQ